MILTLDIGNSQIYGGLFNNEVLQFQFRKTSKGGSSSDEIGVFLRSVLRENDFQYKEIKKIAICSVVPEVVHSIRNACKKYFNMEPFILQAGVKTGLKINYRNPLEVGADRIANAIASTHLYTQKDMIVVDMGTATTFCAISKNKEYLGGTIVAGLKLSMEALESKTSKLPSVEIIKIENVLGRSTGESIQSGLYYGHLGAIKEIIERLTKECFGENKIITIGTGGLSYLFSDEKIFDLIIPDLVLQGLRLALKLNS